jgi:alpha-1,2-mannosyltransferase
LCLEPVKQTLRLGQVNLLLLALVVVDVLWAPARWRGVGVGLAAGLKLTPAIFVVHFAITRQWRAVATSLATFAATVAVSFALVPTDAHRFWFDRLFLDSQRVGDVGYVANQSLEGVLLRVTHDHANAIVLVLVGAVVAAAGLLAAARLHRDGRTVDAFLASAVVGLVVSPISWSHHWVAVALIAAVALARVVVSHARRALVLLVATVLVFVAWPFPAAGESSWAPNGLIWLAPRTNRRGVDWTVLQQLAGNIELVAGVALVALALLSSRRRTA